MENQPQGSTTIFNDGQRQNLPNATGALVLGIISIVGCFCYGIIGLICGIIALVMAKKDMVRYAVNPELYTQSSYNNLKAGRICAIIGIILSALYLILVIVIIAAIGVAGLSHPNDFLQHRY